MKRAAFVITDMQQGLDKVTRLGRSEVTSTAVHYID